MQSRIKCLVAVLAVLAFVVAMSFAVASVEDETVEPIVLNGLSPPPPPPPSATLASSRLMRISMSQRTSRPASVPPVVSGAAVVGDASLEREMRDLAESHRAVVAEARGTAWAPNGEVGFESRYFKVRCGAVAVNFCMSGIQPVYFSASQRGKFFTSSGATAMCNEGGTKHKLHMIMKAEVPRAPPTAVAPTFPMLVVPYCWETYGYHLVLCLMALHAHLTRLQLLEDVRRSAVIAVYKGISFPFQFGSASDWDDANGSLLKDVKPSKYWALWRVVADTPAQVIGLPHVPQRCFSMGVFGGLASTTVNPIEAQRFRADVWQRLGLHPEPMKRECSGATLRVAVIQRATPSRGFAIRNLDEVLQAWSSAGTDAKGAVVEARVVVLENMTLAEQLAVATSSDVITGVHGNGLTWIAMARPGTVCVELWPNAAYNANYATMAMRFGVKHFGVNGDGQCKQRCPASYDVRAVARDAVRHLVAVACEGAVFETTSAYARAQADFKRRKAEKAAKRGY